MTDEYSPDDEILKIKMGDDIPVEEEPLFSKESKEKPDLVNELSNIGKQLGESISAAWNSEERQRFEKEVKQGVQSFAKEVDKAIKEVRVSPAAQKAKDEAAGIKDRVNEADLGQKTQSSIAQGLRWMSIELGNLAEQFGPREKQPEGEMPSDVQDEE
jgi:signal recognition particle GTPase